jgi:hypothetical protein
MTEQINRVQSVLDRSVVLLVIATIHFVAAIGLVVAIVILVEPPPYRIVGIVWLLLLPPLTMTWGLWCRQAWARDLVLKAYSPIFFVATVPFSVCLLFLLLVPARGIAVLHVFAAFGLFFLTPIVLVTGSTVWYLKWTTK